MIDAASADLDRAKSKGLGDFVDVVKASGLIVSATAQRSAETQSTQRKPFTG